jgi:uncharacterized protein YdhG (YjbR/CyaY superfamily)
MAKTKFESVKQYIDSKPKHAQVALKQVQSAIRKAVPEAEEKISYQLPTYVLNGVPLVYFAGWKEHFSVYPAGDALVAEFKEELGSYEVTKGTIRFPLAEPVPVKLIEKIAKFRAAQLKARDKGKRGKNSRDAQLERVRRICSTLPSVSEKPSHGAPTFFVQKDKGVFAMFVDNHHEDGHLAVWLPAPAGMQSALIEDAPQVYFKPSLRRH